MIWNFGQQNQQQQNCDNHATNNGRVEWNIYQLWYNEEGETNTFTTALVSPGATERWWGKSALGKRNKFEV